MFIQLEIPGYICFLIILAWSSEGRLKKRSWIEHLTHYVTKEVPAHQLFLLSDDNPETTGTRIDNIVRRIEKNVPIFHVRIENATNENAEAFNLRPVFNNPRSTTLYLIVTSLKNNSSLTISSKPFEFLARLEPFKRRARCLIVLLLEKRTPSYEQFLREMWDKKFLDSTIFEIDQSTQNKMQLLQKIRPESRIVHYFNPFNNSYVQQNYSLKAGWFPQKLHDMHGWEMKIGFINKHPFVFSKKNLLGEITTTIIDSEYKFISTISKKMNFTFRFQYYDELGKSSCIRSRNTKLLRDLMYQKNINLAIHFMVSWGQCGGRLFEFGTWINKLNVGIIIPAIPASRVSYSTNWHLLNVFLLVALITSLKCLPWLLKFDGRNWRLAYILQIILGFGTPRAPQKLAERIIFGSLLVISVFYSSSIYTAFTGVTLIKNTKLKITNLEELYYSNVIPIINPIQYDGMLSISEGISREILRKSVRKFIDIQECVGMCMKYRNVSCVSGSHRLPRAIKEFEEENGRAGAIFLGSFVPDAWNSLFFESTSPYVEKFDEITAKLKESGFLEKWQKESSEPNNKRHTGEIGTQNNFSSSQLLWVLVSGYLSSFLVFIAEVLFHYFRN